MRRAVRRAVATATMRTFMKYAQWRKAGRSRPHERGCYADRLGDHHDMRLRIPRAPKSLAYDVGYQDGATWEALYSDRHFWPESPYGFDVEATGKWRAGVAAGKAAVMRGDAVYIGVAYWPHPRMKKKIPPGVRKMWWEA